jgi:hypothetical protein
VPPHPAKIQISGHALRSPMFMIWFLPNLHLPVFQMPPPHTHTHTHTRNLALGSQMPLIFSMPSGLELVSFAWNVFPLHF